MGLGEYDPWKLAFSCVSSHHQLGGFLLLPWGGKVFWKVRLALRVPGQTWKSLTDAWNGYYSIHTPLRI